MEKIKHIKIQILAFLLGISFSIFSHASLFNFNPKEGYSTTKYPIVMVGGAFSFDTALGIDYWYGITDRLRNDGANVYVTNLSGAQLNERRGEELLADVQAILDLTGAEKVNLIAHSQGALAARYVASLIPEQIASVTSVHGMNRGTHFSPGFRAAVAEGSLTELIGITLIDATFNLQEFLSAGPSDGDFNSETRRLDQSILKLADATHPELVRDFNARFPAGLPLTDCMNINNGLTGDVGNGVEEVNGVKYYSWGGNKARTHLLDPIDTTLVTFFQLLSPKDTQWDGLVPTCGHSLGKVIRNNYNANHFDAVNQFMGLKAFYYNPPALFSQHANRLKNAQL